MKYVNAAEVLPAHLLREIQKHVSGEVLYIPSGQLRKKWGEGSGARQFYAARNEEIRQKHYEGMDIDTLGEEYSLSIDTIRKIVFK